MTSRSCARCGPSTTTTARSCTFHTGRKITDPSEPALGAWVSYGLGSANSNLPEFIVLGEPSADCCGRSYTFGPAYLGPRHSGVRLNVDPKNPLPLCAVARGRHGG